MGGAGGSGGGESIAERQPGSLLRCFTRDFGLLPSEDAVTEWLLQVRQGSGEKLVRLRKTRIFFFQDAQHRGGFHPDPLAQSF